MRLRNIPGCEDYLNSCESFFVKSSTEVSGSFESPKGRWREIFGNDNPIHAEFGTGRGKFIAEMAMRNPNVNYIGVDMKAEALFKAVKKAERTSAHMIKAGGSGLHNLRYMLQNVDKMEEVFDLEEIDRIYLNFVDPWPKHKHAKRRLTHKRFTKRFENILKAGGELHFKTDNRSLFEFSLNEFADGDLKMKNISLDLANSKFEGNVTTEYEEKFMGKGHPIFRVEVKLK
jgi:tRNA (guanine-N7-)-methyltransferase